MKYDNLVYAVGCALIILSAGLKILHLPYGNAIGTFAFTAMIVFQAWHVSQLKKRIQELENK